MRKAIWITGTLLSFVAAREARADGELTFVGGASISGNISAFSEEFDVDDIEASIKNSPLFGLRIGAYSFPIGFEGSLIYSPSGLTGGAFDELIEANASILYTEVNLLLIPLPGPVSPFVTGGVGLHYLSFEVADLASLNKTKFGYNYGGGLKVNVSRLALRVDLRDHVTTLGLDDFGLGLIGELLGLTDTDARLHNVELSFGIGIRF